MKTLQIAFATRTGTKRQVVGVQNMEEASKKLSTYKTNIQNTQQQPSYSRVSTSVIDENQFVENVMETSDKKIQIQLAQL